MIRIGILGPSEIALRRFMPALSDLTDFKFIGVDMQNKFGLVTGLSDHTIDNTTAITSVALGVSIIEKHVTLDRNGGGPDDSFSLESEDLNQLLFFIKFNNLINIGARSLLAGIRFLRCQNNYLSCARIFD